MNRTQIGAVTAGIRISIADQLTALDDEKLATASLCEGWDLLTVGAHLAASVTVPVATVLTSVIRHGGSMRRTNDRLAREMAKNRPREITELLRAYADRQLVSSRYGPVAPMTEALVHAGDIYRPLGLPLTVPPEYLREALDFLVTVRPFRLVKRGSLERLRIVADELDFSSGVGDAIRGGGEDLLMAACGRASALSALHGPGVDVLRSRLR